MLYIFSVTPRLHHSDTLPGLRGGFHAGGGGGGHGRGFSPPLRHVSRQRHSYRRQRQRAGILSGSDKGIMIKEY